MLVNNCLVTKFRVTEMPPLSSSIGLLSEIPRHAVLTDGRTTLNNVFCLQATGPLLLAEAQCEEM